jgi:epoxyqueuosine reductase
MDKFLRENGCKITDSFVPERWAAAKAGAASFGRNTFDCADGIGSFIVIITFIIDQKLEYDTLMTQCKCPPDCTKCIDACTTNALYQPFCLGPRKCIAFNAWLTISERGICEIIPKQIRNKMEQQVHGCDLCQTAYPASKERSMRNPVTVNHVSGRSCIITLGKIIYSKETPPSL